MQKRVLAFLMVLAIVFSLLPVSLVAAENEAAVADGYILTIQKAYNQTEGSLAVDVYLQAVNAEQANVTGYQFTVTPGEGLIVYDADESTAEGSLTVKVGATTDGAATIVAEPEEGVDMAVGTSRVYLTTVYVKATGEATLPTDVAEFTLSDVMVVQAEGYFQETAGDEADGYLGLVTKATVKTNDVWADVTGTWAPLDQATLAEVGNTWSDVNYYLVEDVTATAQILATNVNLDLNGFTFAAGSGKDFFKAVNGNLTINDATATGSALDGTLKAGTLVAGNNSYGGGVYADYGTVVTVSNVNIDASAVEANGSGYLLYSLGKDASKENGKVVANNVYLFGGSAKADSKDTVLMAEFRGDMELTDVRFANFDLKPGEAANTQKNALVSAIYDAVDGNLVMDNVIAEDCGNYALYLMKVSNKSYASATIKGNAQFADPVYLAKNATVTLDLDDEAQIIIETEEDLTAEEFGTVVTVVDALPAGALFYKNAEQYVTYKDGAFDFASHAHEDMTFKAWRDSTSLPTSGNYYLDTDVTLNCDEIWVEYGETLNLDLNGHTITQTQAETRVFFVDGTMNLYDCAEEYDNDGNWTGGVITGGTKENGGAIWVNRSEEGKLSDADRPTFNMYGGRIAGNGKASKGEGGAVYITASRNQDENKDPAKDTRGGLFNMYGGELYNNETGTDGGAIVVYGLEKHAVGENLGAEFNMYGGKIHGNTSGKGGAICALYDAVVNIEGGEISNNTAKVAGGAVYLNSDLNKLTISDATFDGNRAEENADSSRNLYGCGGAIFIQNNKTNGVEITNSKFKNNTAYRHKAASGFTGNSNAGDGGAIYSYDSVVTIEGCEFTGNSTNRNGGAIAFRGNGSMTINKTTITDNTAGAMGGAIYQLAAAPLTLKDTTITGNTTEGIHGGAVFVYNLNSRLIVSGKTTVADNIKTVTTQKLGSTTVNMEVAKDVYFEHNNSRTNLLEVDGLEKGSRVNVFFPSLDKSGVASTSTVHTNGLASGWVCVKDGGAQETWDCGMVTAFDYDHTEGRSISRDQAGVFTFDHYHYNETLQKQVKYTGVDALPTDFSGLTAESDTYYVYLTGDCTSTQYNPTANVTVCLNHKTVSSTGKVIQLDTGKTLTIEDCTAHVDAEDNYNAGTITSTQNAAYGAGIRVHNGTVILNDGRVYGFKATADNYKGGAVYLYHNNVASNNPVFIMNGGMIGGINVTHQSANTANGLAIFAASNKIGSTTYYPTMELNGGIIADVSMTKSNKSGSTTAYAFAGAVVEAYNATIENVTFQNITMVNNTNGGAVTGGIIRLQGTNNKLKDCHFIDCTVTAKGKIEGGIAYLTGTNSNAVEACEFTNCTVESGNVINGGALYMTGNNPTTTKTTFKNIDITATSTVSGGAIYQTRSGGTVRIEECTFENVQAESQTGGNCLGGAIFLNCSGGVHINKNNFKSCAVTSTEKSAYGGAVYSNAKGINTFDNNYFESCSAKDSGGALYIRKITFTAKNNTFKNCSATTGAVLFGEGTDEAATYNAHNWTVDGNTATTDGGVFMLQGGSKMLNIYGGSYTNNKVTAASDKNNNGGAVIRVMNSDNTVTIDKNEGVGATFTGNECAVNGGVAYVVEGTQISVNGATITGNTAKYGAAMVMWSGSDLALKDTTITGNHTSSGTYGTVYVGSNSSESKLTVSGKVIIDDNTSDKHGESNVSLREFENSVIEIGEGGLSEGSSIGVRARDARFENGIMYITTALDSDCSEYFSSDLDYKIAMLKDDDGNDRLYFVVAEAGENAYTSVQEAIDNANGATVTLYGKNNEELTIPADAKVTINLNGMVANTVAVPEGATLYLIDTTTDSNYNDVSQGSIKVLGDVEAFAETDVNGKNKKHYAVVLDEENNASAYRIYLGVNSRVLRPNYNGVGVSAIFAVNPAFEGNEISYGIELSGDNNFGLYLSAEFDGLEFGLADGQNNPNEKVAVIVNAISKDDTHRWDQNLYCRTYITINGETHRGTIVTINMNDLAKKALGDTNATETVKTAINKMMERCGVSAQ